MLLERDFPALTRKECWDDKDAYELEPLMTQLNREILIPSGFDCPPRCTLVSAPSRCDRGDQREFSRWAKAKLLGHRTRQKENSNRSKPSVSWSHTNTWEVCAVELGLHVLFQCTYFPKFTWVWGWPSVNITLSRPTYPIMSVFFLRLPAFK